jgi:predicted secreted protein
MTGDGVDATENRVLVRREEEFEIGLTSTPSTGYVWGLVACPAEIESVPIKYATPTNDTGSVGGTGTQVFRFRSTAGGAYTITFVLKRPWEKRSIDRRVFQVHVSD